MCKKCEEREAILVAEAKTIGVDFNTHVETVKSIFANHDNIKQENPMDLKHFVQMVKSLTKEEKRYLAAKNLQALYAHYQEAKEMNSKLGSLKDLLESVKSIIGE